MFVFFFKKGNNTIKRFTEQLQEIKHKRLVNRNVEETEPREME